MTTSKESFMLIKAKGILVGGLLTLMLSGCSALIIHDDVPRGHHYRYDRYPVSRNDIVIYKRDPRHVYVRDGRRYRVRYHNRRYRYYPLCAFAVS